MSLAALLLFLTLILASVQAALSDKTLTMEEEISSLESGFEAIKPEMSFSSPFFLLASLFVLFDLEVVLLFPSIYSLMNSTLGLIGWSLVLSLILLTLLLEWAWYGLKWHI